MNYQQQVDLGTMIMGATYICVWPICEDIPQHRLDLTFKLVLKTTSFNLSPAQEISSSQDHYRNREQANNTIHYTVHNTIRYSSVLPERYEYAYTNS